MLPKVVLDPPPVQSRPAATVWDVPEWGGPALLVPGPECFLYAGYLRRVLNASAGIYPIQERPLRGLLALMEAAARGEEPSAGSVPGALG